MYFLSRPRRFGKSLLVSTLEALFCGQKTLFEGLSIYQSDYDFAQHAVIKLEFTTIDVTQQDKLIQYILSAIDDHASTYGICLEREDYQLRFAELVRKLHAKTQRGVVLLVDEYDKPLLNTLGKPELSDIKHSMNAFFAMIKSLDEYLRFVFITGVSKFAKVSVFSGMNNLSDISMDQEYATLCGITEQELQHNFESGINQLMLKQQLDRPVLMSKIKHWYNGYRFHHHGDGVYNPYSVLSLFKRQSFDNYWFATGTPTFLIDLIKAKQFDLSQIDDFEVDSGAFMSIEPEQLSPLIVLLQTGYLTIASYDDGWYRLGFPNHEVKDAFNRGIAQYAQKYQNSTKRLVLLGVEFDQKTRNIGGFIEQTIVDK